MHHQTKATVLTGSNFSDPHPLPQKALQIEQDDKFYSRLLSKENYSNNSFRVYYGTHASGAVPFLWESQPGTPKKASSDTILPPLTPPPSYHLNSKKKPTKNPCSSPKSKLLNTMFPRLNLRKTHVSSPTSLSSSSSVSSFSSSLSSFSAPTTPSHNVHRRNRFSSPRSSFDSRGDDVEEADEFDSPTSILCFGRPSTAGRNGAPTGCYKVVSMKKVFLSIVGGNGNGHGSGHQGTAASA